jgi:hypothetical protein
MPLKLLVLLVWFSMYLEPRDRSILKYFFGPMVSSLACGEKNHFTNN